MLNPVVLVQEPDYVGFRKVSVPIKPLGVVYDAVDPYATPLGVVFAVLEQGRVREFYVKRMVYAEGERTVYMHALDEARYVSARNGFEEGQLELAEGEIGEEAKKLVRAFFQAQNSPVVNKRYLIRACG